MQAYSSTPLVPAHLPRDHPLVTRDYSLFTMAIGQMVELHRGLDRQPGRRRHHLRTVPVRQIQWRRSLVVWSAV
jgi:hypothetical protein